MEQLQQGRIHYYRVQTETYFKMRRDQNYWHLPGHVGNHSVVWGYQSVFGRRFFWPCQPAKPQASSLADWASGLGGWPRGETYGRSDGQTENLPILQDFVPYRGRCLKTDGHTLLQRCVDASKNYRSVRPSRVSQKP